MDWQSVFPRFGITLNFNLKFNDSHSNSISQGRVRCSELTENDFLRRSTTTVAGAFTHDKVEICSKSYDGNGGEKPNVKVRNTEAA
ncbi:MAG: hypothetical protein L3J39_16275 [Verrucomicrobiales bacterium]|nr:hypothetical protein [Verrucomicrobiales bacterium]